MMYKVSSVHKSSSMLKMYQQQLRTERDVREAAAAAAADGCEATRRAHSCSGQTACCVLCSAQVSTFNTDIKQEKTKPSAFFFFFNLMGNVIINSLNLICSVGVFACYTLLCQMCTGLEGGLETPVVDRP